MNCRSFNVNWCFNQRAVVHLCNLPVQTEAGGLREDSEDDELGLLHIVSPEWGFKLQHVLVQINQVQIKPIKGYILCSQLHYFPSMAWHRGVGDRSCVWCGAAQASPHRGRSTIMTVPLTLSSAAPPPTELEVPRHNQTKNK